MSTKKYRDYAPRQSLLFPPSPMDWLPEDHLAFFILDLVDELDLSAIHRTIQAKDPRGTRPYSPAMMVALLLYTWCVGVRSSRKIHRLTVTDVAVRVVAGNGHPHFTTLAEFRRTHAEALAGLFEQVLVLAQQVGLVELTHIAVDGTKIQANASKHKAMSYERMVTTRDRLRKEVEQILAEAEAVDRAEDEQFGADKDGAEMPAELRRRETRIARIREAMAALEKEARQARAEALEGQAKQAEQQAADPAVDPPHRKAATTRARKRRTQAASLRAEDDGEPAPAQTPEGLVLHRPPVEPDGRPKPRAQRNFTDPDSRLMESGGAFLQAYNCQAAVDDKAQIIVACAVSNQPPDADNLVPMVALARANCGRAATFTTADTGFWTAEVETRCRELGTNALVATGRRRRSEPDPKPIDPDDLPDTASPKQRMQAKLTQPENRAVYRRRKAVVEPVFGQIKEARGLRRFHRRGLDAVRAEWAFDCTCHNLLKLFRSGYRTVTTA